MSPKDGSTRVVGGLRTLDYATTSSFFQGRGQGASENPLTATMYQSEELAKRRDREEKSRILPLMSFGPTDRVLDLGCGTGRWAEAVAETVDAYLGIDFSEPLLEVARERVKRASFQAMNVARLEVGALAVLPPFTAIICSGILIYINDEDIRAMFRLLSDIASPSCRIYLREPMAKEQRLTLDRHWSDELKDHYSAIYRTRNDYVDLVKDLTGFSLVAEGEPFSPELQNRVDTRQQYMMLSRQQA